MKRIPLLLISSIALINPSFADRSGGYPRLSDYMHDIVQQINENTHNINELGHELAELKELIGSIGTGGGTGGTTDPALLAQVNTNTADIASLQTAVAGIQINSTAISSVQTQLSSMTSSISSLTADSQTANNNMAALGSDLATLAADLLALTNRVNGQDSRINANTANVSINAGRIDVLEAATTDTGNGATVYDYHSYISTTIISKTFNIRGLGSCPTEERSYTRTPTADGTLTQIHRLRADIPNLTVCQDRTFDYLASADSLLLVQSESVANGNVTQTKIVDSPSSQMTSSMQVGQSYGHATTVQTTDSTNNVTESGLVEIHTLVAVEDVAVPYGNFTACLKIHSNRRSENLGQFSRVSWRCEGVGEVKRISVNLNTNAVAVWELSNMQ